jgi:hypothetical protein
MTAITAQWRRLRQVFTMLTNLQKGGLDLNLTTHNMLLDIKKLVDKLVEESTIYHG